MRVFLLHAFPHHPARVVNPPWPWLPTLGWRVILGLGICVFSTASSVVAQSTLTNAAATPPQQASAAVILPAPGIGLCPELVQDFNDHDGELGLRREDLLTRCREVVIESGRTGSNINQVRDGLQAMAPEEVATQGTSMTETSNTQFSNITTRLAALRGGATGISLRQFALHLDRQTIPLNLVASNVPMGLAAEKEVPERSGAFKRLGIFASGEVNVGDKDATSRESGFDFESYGLTLGADYRLNPKVVLGVALGYMTTDIDLDQDGGQLKASGFSGSLYGTYHVSDPFYIDGIVSVGRNDYDIDRAIRYSIRELNPDGTPTGGMVTIDQVAQADSDGTWYGFSLSTGYDFYVAGLTVGPIARLNYSRADLDGYQENIDNTAAGSGLALSVEGQKITSFSTVLGGQASYAISLPWGVVLPQLRLEWEHEFENASRTIRANFLEDPTPDDTSQIQLLTDAPDRDFFNIAAGVSAVFRRGLSAFVQYQTVIGLADVNSHHVALGLRIEL